MTLVPPYGTTLARWKNFSEWPLTAGALVFLAAYSFSVLEDLTPAEAIVPNVVMNVIWTMFAVDYVVCLVLARPRGRWFVTHLHELLIVVLPVIRPLRLLRLVFLFGILQRTVGVFFRGRILVYLVSSSLLLVLITGLAMLDVEQDAPGSNIVDFGDAIWWAFETITTVGYGDFYPVTVPGRFIAVGLMVAGVAMLGTVTATFASWFLELVAKRSEKVEEADTARFEEMAGEIRALREQLDARDESGRP